MPQNTQYLSDDTTDFTSNVSIAGTLVLQGALESASALSVGALTATTGVFTSTLSAGGAATFQAAITANSTFDSASAISGAALTGTTGDFNSTLTVTDFARFGALSIKTVGAALTTSNVSQDELIMFVLQSSGASLGIRSGSTIWIFDSTDSVAG